MEETSQEVVVLEFKPEIFDPKKEQLKEIAAEVAKITADPEKMTGEDLELIKTTKNKLVKARTSITKAGKAARDAANKYNKDVKAYENELIAIIEPEEKRLKELSDAAEAHATREARKETLPEYKAKLDAIGDGIVISDEELLDMDPTQFTEYYNKRQSDHLEAEREKMAAEKEADEKRKAEEEAARKAEEERLEKEREAIEKEKFNAKVQRLLTLGFKEAGSNYTFGKEGQVADAWIAIAELKTMADDDFEKIYSELSSTVAATKERWAKEEAERVEKEKQEAAEQARQEAEAKAQAEKEAEEKARQEKEEAERKEKEEAERKAAEEQASREKAEKYQKWCDDNSYNPETDIIEFKDGISTLYRKVSTYDHNDTPVVE